MTAPLTMQEAVNAVGAKERRMAAPKDTVAYYDRISKNRALTDIESRRLEAAIKLADLPMTPRGWTAEQDGTLCDIIADGLGFTLAGRAVGKTKNAAISRFRKIARNMGEAL